MSEQLSYPTDTGVSFLKDLATKAFERAAALDKASAAGPGKEFWRVIRPINGRAGTLAVGDLFQRVEASDFNAFRPSLMRLIRDGHLIVFRAIAATDVPQGRQIAVRKEVALLRMQKERIDE